MTQSCVTNINHNYNKFTCSCVLCNSTQAWCTLFHGAVSLLLKTGLLIANQIWEFFKVMIKPSIHYNNLIYRLHSVDKLNLQSMLLCIAIHGSKVPLCLSMVLPYSPVAASVLLPSLFLISPSFLMFLFTFAVSKVIEAPRDMTLNEVNFILCHRVVFGVFFQGLFWGAYFWRDLYSEGLIYREKFAF